MSLPTGTWKNRRSHILRNTTFLMLRNHWSLYCFPRKVKIFYFGLFAIGDLEMSSIEAIICFWSSVAPC